MRRGLSLFLIMLVGFLISGRIYGGGNQNSQKTAYLYCNNNSARIEYSVDFWIVREFSNREKYIQIKTEKKVAAISLSRVPSTLGQESYIADFKNYIQQRSIDRNIGEETVNGYPVLTYRDREKPLKFAIMVIKDGAGYFEITFCCYKSLYKKYKPEAFKVFGSFQKVKHKKIKVIEDPEAAAGLKALDKSAGYDDEAVRKNLSDDGAELVGVWHLKNNLNNTITFMVDGTFQENIRTTLDQIEYIEGIWQYNRPAINLTCKKILIDSRDVSDQIRVPTITYIVKNFDGKTMLVIVPQASLMRTFIKD